MKSRGVVLVILGAVLVLVGGPATGIAFYYAQDSAAVAMAAAVTVQMLGAVLIVVGAVRNSRAQRQRVSLPPPPPPISN